MSNTTEKLASPADEGEAGPPSSTSTLAATKPLDPPPEGGAKAWLTVLGGFCAVFVQFGLANSFGVFQGYYEEHQLRHYSSSTISWIGALQQFILYFGGLFAGPVFDAYGAQALIVPGSALFVLSLMMTSLCQEYYQFMLAQGVLFGLGSSMIFHPTVSCPSQWFARRRALATSIVICGSGLGGTLWPIALRRLIDDIGFAWALRTVGFISLAFLATAVACIRTRLPRRDLAPLTGVLDPLRELPFSLFAMGVAFASWGMFTPLFFITTNAASLGASSSLAFYTLSFVNAGSTLGRLFAGVADNLGRMNTIILSTFLTGVLQLAFWVPLNTLPALIAFGPMFGFTLGMVISLIPPTVAQMSPQPHQIGARMGLTWAMVALFALSGPPINGALLSAKGGGRKGYQDSGIFSGVVVLVGTALMLAARLRTNPKLRAVL